MGRSGYIIKVTSERENKQTIHGASHASETSMDTYDKIDFHVKNDGSLIDLQGSAKQVAIFLIKCEKMKKKLED